MKIVEETIGSEKVVELELSNDDLNIIDAIVPPPFGEMNKVPGLEWLNQAEIEGEKEYLIKSRSELVLKVRQGFLVRLAFGFKASCEILDPCEMEMLTNIQWKDSMEVYGKLFHAAHASSKDGFSVG